MRRAEPITERQIALAATQFIRAKLNVYDLKVARANALTSNPCVLIANSYPPCFRMDPVLSTAEWCDNCKANQPHHEAYRTAAAKKAASLRKLQQLVVRSIADKSS